MSPETVNTGLMDRIAKPTKLAFTVSEAAELLALSRSFMYELIQAGKIETITIGRARRITAVQLQSFLAAQSSDR